MDGQIKGIAVDSWGVDYGLIDENGDLLEKPYHYRDSRTDRVMDKAFELMGKEDIYNATGIQFMQLNTIFQLLSLRLDRPSILQKTKHLILMADLVSYYLCGQVYSEYSLASTSQLMDMKSGQWSQDVFDKLSLPMDIMPKVVAPGTVVGKLKTDIAEEMGCGAIDVIAIGAHDTASAVAAVPASDKNWAYLSSGTWSLMGLEICEAIINEQTFKYQFTNEGGIANTIRLLKNIMGLWIVQECRRYWQSEGEELSYSQIVEMAENAESFAAFINPNDNTFFAPGDMPERVNSYLLGNGQGRIDDKGQMMLVVLESLAFNYRWVLEKLEDINGKRIDVLHMVGGGIQNQLLCQLTANAIGRKVIAGPIEATASGNIIAQAIATGEIESLRQARSMIADSFELEEYLPCDSEKWNEQYAKVKNIFG